MIRDDSISDDSKNKRSDLMHTKSARAPSPLAADQSARGGKSVQRSLLVGGVSPLYGNAKETLKIDNSINKLVRGLKCVLGGALR